MTTNNQWDADDDDDQQQQQKPGKGLREQLERALQENKDLKTRADRAESQARQAAISNVLKDKGIPAKVAKLLPADVEPTEDAVTKWLDEFGDVFVPKSTEPAPADDSDDANADTADAMGRLAGATGAGKAPTKDADMLQRLQSKDLTQEQLIEIINAAGGGYGSG